MAEKSACASRVAAFILMGTNLLFMSLCGGAFVLGLWVIASPESLSSVIQASGDATLKALLPREFLEIQLGIAMAVLSIFLFSIALMGFYGAVDHSQFLLLMYSILVILLLLLESSLLFYYTSNIAEKGLQEGDDQLNHALRLIFKCCERSFASNTSEAVNIPWSCCGVRGFPGNCTDRVYGKDCQETITSWLDTYQGAIYLPLAVFHVMLSFCSLVRRADASLSHS